MKDIRPLRADEVDLRMKGCVEGKAQFLLYVDSRACRRILDETFGVLGWQDTYTEIKGALYCTIEVWDDEYKHWVAKQDCGVASYTEKVKGEARDAFKRACFSLGIGRELYTKIPIWIKIDTVEQKSNDGKSKHVPKNRYISFTVSRLEVNRNTGKIKYLCIVDKNNERVFEWGFSDDPYIDEETEQTRRGLLLYCEEYEEITGTPYEKAFRAVMRKHPKNIEGYVKAILEMKERIKKEKAKKEEADRQECEGL